MTRSLMLMNDISSSFYQVPFTIVVWFGDCLQEVVWERLCAVNGNTDFVRADFSGFVGRSVMADALTAASLAQEAFSSVIPASAGDL